MSIINQIKTEIERQREEIRPTNTGEMKVVGTPTQLEQGWLNALSWMEKVLDTLKEQPVCEGLEEEIERMYLKDTLTLRTRAQYADLARHFAQWGAEHLKK